jgi:DNA modification methylase
MQIKDRIKELRRVKASELIPNPKNWRTHPVAQQDALKGVLAEVGYADALIARETADGLMLVDGHLRAETTPDSEVPVLILDINAEEADLMLATLDPLAAMAGRDEERLSELLETVTSDNQAVAEMLNNMAAEIVDEKPKVLPKEEDAFDVPDTSEIQRGDLFQLGNHRLLCGDSTNATDIETLMGGRMASLIHADPPYGMNKGFDNDNLHDQNLDEFQMRWWNALRPYVDGNASAYIWGNTTDLWRLWHEGGLKESERLTLRNEIVWDKGGGGMSVRTEAGRMFQSSERCLFFMLGEQGFNNNADNYWEGWEPIRSKLEADCKKMGWGPKDIERICGVGMYSHWFTKSQWVFITQEHYEKLQQAAKGDAFKRDYDDLKRDYDDLKRDYDDLKREFYATRAYFDNSHEAMTDVWKFPRVKGADRHDHATPKPVLMIIRSVKSSCEVAGLVVDPFSGTGTTLMASEYADRSCYAMEIEPRYCDVAIKRWEDYTGEKAVKV